jgi:hypothetical protein
MPNIQISDAQYQRLSALAHAAGYQDVLAFIASCTDVPVQDPRGALAEVQLLENVAKIHRGEKEIESGGGQNMKDAIVEIAGKHGLNIGQ